MRLNRLAFSYPRKIVNHLLNLLISSGSVYCAKIHRLLLLLEVSIALHTEKKVCHRPNKKRTKFMQIP